MNYDAVIDAHAWIAYFKGEKGCEVVKDYIENKKTMTPTIVLAELSDKFTRLGDEEWAEAIKFIRATSAVIGLTTLIAVNAGKTKNSIRAIKGKTNFGLADAIIYETAHQYNTKVLTGDPHFKGLKDVVWIR